MDYTLSVGNNAAAIALCVMLFDAGVLFASNSDGSKFLSIGSLAIYFHLRFFNPVIP